MTKVVYKYPFEVVNPIFIDMPKDAQILTVQTQNGKPCLWALVEPNNPIVKREFWIRGTGHPVDAYGQYIATIQMLNGVLVFHIFESIAP